MATSGLSAILFEFGDKLHILRPWRWRTLWSPPAAAAPVAPAALSPVAAALGSPFWLSAALVSPALIPGALW